MELNHIYTGDALKVLQELPTESVNCIVTSPPYYGLRNYCVDGQIGLEPTPEQYIQRLTEVFMECMRVLKKDGTMWIVIGDSYAGSGRGKGDINKKGIQQKASYAGEFCKPYQLDGYKNKDLMGIPWALAFARRWLVLAPGYNLAQTQSNARKYPRPLHKGARVCFFIQ